MRATPVEARRRIAASVDTLFGLISDPIAMAVWNPSFDRVEWLHGAEEPVPGARFQVQNVNARFDWDVEECVVIENDGARSFGFAIVHRDRDSAVQRFELVPDGEDTTEVVVTFERRHVPFAQRLRRAVLDQETNARRGLQAALEGLEHAAVTG